MQCPQCQFENREGVRFCEECGAKLDLLCPACGATIPPERKFCGECGAPLTVAASPAAPPVAPEPASRFTSPQAYTPQHLAERIISSRGALEGERKQVTVLFADLKGSMELLADRDPEEARRILDPVLERMMEAVHRYEGTVNQVMGDGIMALFGAPLAHEDHAVRACYAALRMQDTVKEYAEELRRTEGAIVQIRVGLNSGEVVVRSVGSDLRMDYTAVGQTTHLAARMEQLATPGSILLAPDALQLVEGYVRVQPLGPVQVKGLGDPMEVYELIGAGTARSRLQAAAARGLTTFVGRDAELETLRRTLEQASAGHGQVMALVGEPGVGKSRLVWEFTHSHRVRDWLVLESGSVSYGKATSYLPLIDLLRNYCGIEGRDDARRIREKLTGKLLTLDRTLEPTLPALLALLDVPLEDPQWESLDPPQRRQRTLDAGKRLLLRESQEQPLLLIFEDLHWIDTETQALLDALVDSLPTARLLLVVNYRPEYEHKWHRKTYYQQLRLDPLPPESAEQLLAALLGDATELQSLKRVLIERTEGNPFFVEESVRTLVEGGVLAGERSTYRLAKAFESTQVPATVQAVLAARIDRLPPEDKRLLQAAAVIGKDLPYPLLRAVAELPEDRLRQGLVRLQTAEFLYETSLFPDLEYTFKHALTHEIAYGGLLQERRRALHGCIIGALETAHPDRLAEQVERLAHHAVRGEAWEKAVAYCRQAGHKADARSALREAVGYFEQALDALGHLPDTHETRVGALDLRLDLHSPLLTLGEFDRVLAGLTVAQTLAETVDDRQRLGRVLTYVANSLSRKGEHQRAVGYGERALAIADELDDPELKVRATFHALGQTYHALGDYDRAISLLRRTLALIPDERRGDRYGLLAPASIGAAHYLIWSLAERGEFEEAAALAIDVQRIGENTGRTIDSAWCHLSSGYLLLLRGELDAAAPTLERGLAICEAASVMTLLPRCSSGLGYAYALAGRAPEGVAFLERGVEQARGIVALQALRLAWLSEAYLLAGRTADARAIGEQALALTRSHHERANEAWTLRLLGEIAASADPPEAEQAERNYRQALAFAGELGMRPLAAHCHLGLGVLYQKVGRDAEAQAELVTAAEAYRTMGMAFWLAKAEAALAGATPT
jgi:class 3 adenylate cyclase/tetratricopeptide (TPR) repeat protein